MIFFCFASFQVLSGGTQSLASSTQSPTPCPNAPTSPGCSSATAINVGALSPEEASQTSNSGGGIRPVSSCCENGRPIMTDPVTGQTICSCQYDPTRITLSGYSRLPATAVGVYGTPYPSTDQNPYPSIGVDNSAFYSPLVSILARPLQAICSCR